MDVLKALHSLAHGNAMGISGKIRVCPEGATQIRRLIVLPLQGKWYGFLRNLGRCPRLNCAARCLSFQSLLSCLQPRFASAQGATKRYPDPWVGEVHSASLRWLVCNVLMKRIGLARGGGGAKGFAHIPILEVFDELGIKPYSEHLTLTYLLHAPKLREIKSAIRRK